VAFAIAVEGGDQGAFGQGAVANERLVAWARRGADVDACDCTSARVAQVGEGLSERRKRRDFREA